MQSNLTNVSKLERKLDVTIPAESIKARIEQKLREIARRAKLPGFRPGKVPFEVIKKNYFHSTRGDVMRDLVQDSYIDAIKQHNVSPVGMPNIQINSGDADESCNYTAIFEVYPEIALKDLKQITVEKPTAKIADHDLHAMLERMRKAHTKWQEITEQSRKSKAGDQLEIDFTVIPIADEEGKKVEPKVEKNAKIVLGDGSMWKDFESQLYDLNAGSEKNYTLKIPDTHVDKDLAGKEAEFQVKVHKINEPIVPELDDNFAAQLQFTKGGIEELKTEVRSHLEKELENTLKEQFKSAISEKLLEHHEVDLPKVLVESEMKAQEQAWRERFAHLKDKSSLPAFPTKDFEAHAKRNVSLGLLIAEIVKEHKLKVEMEEVRGKIAELASSYYDDSSEAIEKMLRNERYVDNIRAMLLEDKVINHLASQVNVVDKETSYQDLMGKK